MDFNNNVGILHCEGHMSFSIQNEWVYGVLRWIEALSTKVYLLGGRISFICCLPLSQPDSIELIKYFYYLYQNWMPDSYKDSKQCILHLIGAQVWPSPTLSLQPWHLQHLSQLLVWFSLGEQSSPSHYWHPTHSTPWSCGQYTQEGVRGWLCVWWCN